MSEHHRVDTGAAEPEAAAPAPAPAPAPYRSLMDRRTTLAWLGAAGVAIPALAHAQSPNDREKAVVEAKTAKGYGTDPELVKPKPAPWPRVMTPAQLQTAALICEFILPASGKAPSANTVGVPDFIDEWVSAPYPAQVADRPIILDGLSWVEGEARRRFGKNMFDAAPADRTALLTTLTVKPSDPAAQKPHAFFRRFRALTIGGYYTTQPGFKDIGYIGNVARASDPGPSAEVKAALDSALTKLGL